MNNWLGLNARHWHSKHVLLHNVDTVANMCPCYPLHGPITICPCHTIATWMASTSEGCCSCGPEPSKPTQHDLMQNIDPPLSDSSCQHNKPVWRDISYDIIEKLPATKPTTSLQNQSFGVTRREKPFKSGSAQQEGPTAFEQQWGLKAKQPTHHTIPRGSCASFAERNEKKAVSGRCGSAKRGQTEARCAADMNSATPIATALCACAKVPSRDEATIFSFESMDLTP